MFASSAVSSSPSSTSLAWRTTFLATVLRALEIGTILGCARRALRRPREPPEEAALDPPKDSSPLATTRGAGATRRRRAARWSARRRGSTAARYGVRAVDVARISWDTRRGRDEECASLLRQQLREEACNRPKKCTYTRAFRNRPEIFVVHQRTSHDIVQKKKAGRALGSSWRHVIGCFDGNPFFFHQKVPANPRSQRGVFVSASPRTSLVVSTPGAATRSARTRVARAPAPRAPSAC